MWSCGENLIGAIPGLHSRQVDRAHVLVEKVYRAALLGAAPDTALLGEVTGAQFRRFVDDLLQLLAWYPSPELYPRFTDPQNLHLSFRAEILAIVGALVMNAAPDSEPNCWLHCYAATRCKAMQPSGGVALQSYPATRFNRIPPVSEG